MLEICVDNFKSVAAAVSGGADRLEVCNELVVGGLTPSYTFVKAIKKEYAIPQRCMIRPRSGDFCYTDIEYEQMKQDVEMFKSLDVEGIVFGILNPDGSIDMPRMKEIISLAGDMKIVLHRAFDMASNPFEALEQARELGVDTILTSGQKASVWEGRELLRDLSVRSSNIEILAGGSIKLNLIEPLWKEYNIKSFHTSASKVIIGPMIYKNYYVHMGLPGLSEYEMKVTQEDMVKAIKDEIRELEKNTD